MVAEAYQAAGVTMPADAWGCRWQEWLIKLCDNSYEAAQVIHKRKCQAYTEIIANTDLTHLELPAARVARSAILNDGPRAVRYLTAGTDETAHLILARLGILSILRAGLTYVQRRMHLGETPPNTVYVDDNLDTIARLTVDVPHLRLVAVTGQSLDQLLYEIRRED